MVRPIDQETTDTEKIVYFTQSSQEKKYTSCGGKRVAVGDKK